MCSNQLLNSCLFIETFESFYVILHFYIFVVMSLSYTFIFARPKCLKFFTATRPILLTILPGYAPLITMNIELSILVSPKLYINMHLIKILKMWLPIVSTIYPRDFHIYLVATYLAHCKYSINTTNVKIKVIILICK